MVILERSGGERPSITGGLCFNFFRTKQNETRKQQTLGFTLKVFYISQITITLFTKYPIHGILLFTHIALPRTKTRLS